MQTEWWPPEAGEGCDGERLVRATKLQSARNQFRYAVAQPTTTATMCIILAEPRRKVVKVFTTVKIV